ncbi:hypothetical protein OSTOST_12097 [Ostertagia ostertagi]
MRRPAQGDRRRQGVDDPGGVGAGRNHGRIGVGEPQARFEPGVGVHEQQRLRRPADEAAAGDRRSRVTDAARGPGNAAHRQGRCGLDQRGGSRHRQGRGGPRTAGRSEEATDVHLRGHRAEGKIVQEAVGRGVVGGHRHRAASQGADRDADAHQVHGRVVAGRPATEQGAAAQRGRSDGQIQRTRRRAQGPPALLANQLADGRQRGGGARPRRGGEGRMGDDAVGETGCPGRERCGGDRDLRPRDGVARAVRQLAGDTRIQGDVRPHVAEDAHCDRAIRQITARRSGVDDGAVTEVGGGHGEVDGVDRRVVGRGDGTAGADAQIEHGRDDDREVETGGRRGTGDSARGAGRFGLRRQRQEPQRAHEPDSQAVLEKVFHGGACGDDARVRVAERPSAFHPEELAHRGERRGGAVARGGREGRMGDRAVRVAAAGHRQRSGGHGDLGPGDGVAGGRLQLAGDVGIQGDVRADVAEHAHGHGPVALVTVAGGRADDGAIADVGGRHGEGQRVDGRVVGGGNRAARADAQIEHGGNRDGDVEPAGGRRAGRG